MSTKNKSGDFGGFLTKLMLRNSEAVSSTALESIKKKMEAEKALEVENELRQVAYEIKNRVESIRSYRIQIKKLKIAIERLEEKADKIVAGNREEADDDSDD